MRIRGERWRIAAERRFDDASIIEVEGCDAANSGTKAGFIMPFERVDALTRPASTPRIVTVARWRRAARTLLGDAVPQWTSLRAAARASLTILPFQLEAAIAVARGDASRVLIADAVGLGKTIQAGLVIAETIARAPDARVLVVSPAGLRDQWCTELRSRFALHAEVLDAEGVARSSAQLVPDVNPWSIHALAITSIDYIKRPEVMRALETLIWDVVVFDEAHALTGRSDRATAAATLARRARVVVLLTATPHSGDDEAFARLCAIGDIDNGFPLVTFRRTRADVGLPHGRRLTTLRVRPTHAEAAMHRALDEYVRRLTQESDGGAAGGALVASILTRRACSSACSLARSLERRAALLAGAASDPRDQLPLPFADGDTDDEPGGELGGGGLRDTAEEQRCLRALAELARAASSRESKLQALARLIRRAGEPVLVFTEYRDTLQHLSAALAHLHPLQLHGGMPSRERTGIVRRFTSGGARVLLATDAASEGLNLHHHCRLVINLELPWTPLRLEQRIGRVDRLGQHRCVHAVQLIARGTKEESIEDRLEDRTARAHAALRAGEHAGRCGGDEARVEAARIVRARSLGSDGPRSSSNHAPFVLITSNTRRVSSIWAYRLSCVDEGGHVTFETIAGFVDPEGRLWVDDELAPAVARHHEQLRAKAASQIAAWADAATSREKAMVSALRQSHARLSAALLQPGLFDRRAERAAAAQAARADEAIDKSRVHLAQLARCRTLCVDERTLVFGVTFRP